MKSFRQYIKEQVSEYDDLFHAIGEVESGNDDDAVGDDGNALGRYQIWEIYWQDAIEHDPSIGGEYTDVTNPEYARKVMLAYWDRYATKKRLGHEPTLEDLARIHNGGPNGFKRDSTLGYWEKVKDVLEGTPLPDDDDISIAAPSAILMPMARRGKK